MSRTAAALLALAVLVSVVHYAWERLLALVDLDSLPGQTRRHVSRVRTHSGLIQFAAVALAAAAAAIQLSRLVS